MDAGKLFSELVNRQPDQSGGILTGTAVSDSVDGSVMVQMDGSVVAQPGEDEVTLTVSADDFVDGSYVLPSVPYAGSLTISDSDGNELEEQDYELDGARLTIFALSSSPIDIAYQTQVLQQVTNDDFDGDRYSLASVTNLTVEEMDSEGAWNPATYTLDGNILTIAGIEHQAGIVEFTYIYDVSVVCEPGENVLPDSPDDVSVLGRNSSGVDVVVTDYSLDGNVITLPTTYDAYTVDYPVTTTETWNVSDQYLDEPLEDSDDAADPAIVTIGHNLQWPPSSVVSCTIDGIAATYTLDDVNVVVDAPAVTERWFRLTYDAPVSLQVPASVFATGAFTLPSIPLGSVSTVRAGIVLENVVDDDQLTIASLVVDSPTYSIAYTEQVEQDAVELPCTPYVAEGQFVEVAVVNGMPTVIGASGSGDVTMTLAGEASDAAQAAEDAAEAAQAVADRVSEHFWTDTDGVHVTEVTQEEWQTSPTGSNQLSNSAGILLRDGTNPIVSVATGADPGMSIFDGAGSQASNVMATFTGSGVTLGKAAETHAEIDYHSLQLIDREGNTYFHVSDLRDTSGSADVTQTFIGDGETYSFYLNWPIASVTDVTVDGTSASYYVSGPTLVLHVVPPLDAEIVVSYRTDSDQIKAYTLGTRYSNSALGPMSVAEGVEVEASGEVSHAEGARTIASGSYSHSEGLGTGASGLCSHAEGRYSHATEYCSHAEGYGTYADGPYSHAEGQNTNAAEWNSHAEGSGTIASGNGSHAQNINTKASSEAQTALGRHNVEDANDTYAVIIGNGTDDNNRSNALTVDWSGNVGAAGGATLTGNLVAANLGGAYYSGDMNDLVTPGIYYVAGASTNLPVAVGSMVWLTVSENIVVQVCIVRQNNYDTYVRQRTASGNWGAWARVGGTKVTDWVSLGSTTGTTALSFDLTNYNEVCIVARYSTAYLGSIVLPKAALHASTEYEAYLGGWGNPNTNSNRRAVAKINRSKLTPVVVTTDQTDRTSSSTWTVYAR